MLDRSILAKKGFVNDSCKVVVPFAGEVNAVEGES